MASRRASQESDMKKLEAAEVRQLHAKRSSFVIEEDELEQKSKKVKKRDSSLKATE